MYNFSEPDILKEIQKYIDNTYGAHYTSVEGRQLIDSVIASGKNESIPFCRWNAIKYIERYGKKNGYNRKDLLKAVHYIMFLLYIDNKFQRSDVFEREYPETNDYYPECADQSYADYIEQSYMNLVENKNHINVDSPKTFNNLLEESINYHYKKNGSVKTDFCE